MCHLVSVTVFILRLLRLSSSLLFSLLCRLDEFGSINEAIPSATVFGWRVCPRFLVQVCMAVVGMPPDDAVLGPANQGVLVDVKTLCHLLFGQHTSVPEPKVSWTELVPVHQIRYALGTEAVVLATRPC